MALANDLTKLFESVWRGRISEILARLELEEARGEYTIVIGGKVDEKKAAFDLDEV